VNYDDKEILVIEGEQEEEEKDNSQIPFTPSLLYSYACTSAVNAVVEPRPSFVLQRYDFKVFWILWRKLMPNAFRTLRLQALTRH